MTIDGAEIKQKKYAEKFDELRTYSARVSKYIDLNRVFLKMQKFL